MARTWLKATKLKAEGKCTVTISPKGLISFSRRAIDEFSLNNFKYVEIGKDDELKAILLKFHNEKTDDSVILSIGKTKEVAGETKPTVSASIKSFLNQMNIEQDTSMRFEFSKDELDPENCFCIIWDTGVVVQRTKTVKVNK